MNNKEGTTDASTERLEWRFDQCMRHWDLLGPNQSLYGFGYVSPTRDGRWRGYVYELRFTRYFADAESAKSWVDKVFSVRERYAVDLEAAELDIRRKYGLEDSE
jgi:hypothetical protein